MRARFQSAAPPQQSWKSCPDSFCNGARQIPSDVSDGAQCADTKRTGNTERGQQTSVAAAVRPCGLSGRRTASFCLFSCTPVSPCTARSCCTPRALSPADSTSTSVPWPSAEVRVGCAALLVAAGLRSSSDAASPPASAATIVSLPADASSLKTTTTRRLLHDPRRSAIARAAWSPLDAHFYSPNLTTLRLDEVYEQHNPPHHLAAISESLLHISAELYPLTDRFKVAPKASSSRPGPGSLART